MTGLHGVRGFFYKVDPLSRSFIGMMLDIGVQYIVWQNYWKEVTVGGLYIMRNLPI